MMISRILLAVDDSPAALAAARVTVELAQRLDAQVLAVNVLADHVLSNLLARHSADADIARRRGLGAASVLDHVAQMAERAGVSVETQQLEGDVARHVLRLASAWHADMVVIGRSGQHGPGEPYVGSETAHVLEFAELPVLVVPLAPTGHAAG